MCNIVCDRYRSIVVWLLLKTKKFEFKVRILKKIPADI